MNERLDKKNLENYQQPTMKITNNCLWAQTKKPTLETHLNFKSSQQAKPRPRNQPTNPTRLNPTKLNQPTKPNSTTQSKPTNQRTEEAKHTIWRTSRAEDFVRGFWLCSSRGHRGLKT